MQIIFLGIPQALTRIVPNRLNARLIPEPNPSDSPSLELGNIVSNIEHLIRDSRPGHPADREPCTQTENPEQAK